ncbi:hypothetical protein LCGC14_0883080 [marine sediment metagenome]|uniref:Uncharacterized protein n=1 Tax=marine sediment metagenome TaxID=412755 RepID=A0A0F9RKT9_9ZZZZ
MIYFPMLLSILTKNFTDSFSLKGLDLLCLFLLNSMNRKLLLKEVSENEQVAMYRMWFHL